MSTPEQDFLQALSDALKGTPMPRLVARRGRQIGVTVLKHKVTGQTLMLQPQHVRDYMAMGVHYFSVLRPIGPTETRVVQRIQDAEWRVAFYTELQGAIEPAPPHFARQVKRLRSSITDMTGDYKKLRTERLEREGDRFTLETCEAYQWYRGLTVLAERLVGARNELERKSAVKAGRDGAPASITLELKEPLTPSTIEVLAEAYLQGLLSAAECTLFVGASTGSTR